MKRIITSTVGMLLLLCLTACGNSTTSPTESSSQQSEVAVSESATLLSEMAGTGNWQDGYRFSSNASDSEITEWLSTLNY